MTDIDDVDLPTEGTDGLPESIADNIEQSGAVERVYDAMMGVRQPAPISAVAELAHCDESEAESTVQVLVELNVVTETTVEGEQRYYRNEQFFQWLRASKLADEYGMDGLSELRDKIDAEMSELKGLYGVDQPEDITLPEQNEALRQRVRKDAMRWGVLEQTKTDIEIAEMLHENDPEK